ncbi:MAG TPA: S9 family peptidase [Acidimicrobiia bacterium]|nr:S9 family peptidase [Acidimicrobiia bacterium]
MTGPTPEPPIAPRRPHVLRHGDDERVDDWFWLRRRDDPEVITYLEAENAYTRAALAHTEALQGRIFEEIVARVQETDATAPVRKDAWEYFSRSREGLQYSQHCRRPAGTPGLPDPAALAGSEPGEELVLDENELAGNSGYFALGGFAISPAHDRLAYSVDLTGGEVYTLRFRAVTPAEPGGGPPPTVELPDEIPGTYYGLAWANDGATVFYVRPDEAIRPYQVWRHTLGTPASDDVLVFQEDDERYFVSVERTRTGRYVVVTTASKLTTEAWFVDADAPTEPLRVVAPREEGVEYHVEHHADPAGEPDAGRFYILTNAGGAENFMLAVAPVADPGRAGWETVVAHRPDVRLEDVDAFAGHLVLSERARGLERLRVIRLVDGDEHVVEMPEEVYSAWMGSNPEFESTTIRFGYTSLVAPPSDYAYDLDTRETTLVKQHPVLGYDPARFETHRLWATATDGTEVPISIVHPRDFPRDGTGPLLLYGYGSYEISIDPAFSTTRLSLLERGCAYAIAHVRGGGELGRRWYEDGKFAHKPNTFTDFVACAEHLVAIGYASPARLAARGGSAGGLLMGAVANLRPDLFRAIVAEVPFVDCLTTILDASLPLTVTEWEEWGNPASDPVIYATMKAYSPYDNVGAHDYPAMLVTGGLNDPRVQYWEPAKWVAKLRATKTDDRLLVLKTEMDAGHSGPSGRYDAWGDEAFVLAFLLDQLGLGGGA